MVEKLNFLECEGIMKFCEECGAKLEDDAKFCEECGAAVEDFTEGTKVEDSMSEEGQKDAMDEPLDGS